MEIDDLKSEWNTVEYITKSDESLVLMLQENKHPVLKSIRTQIRIEVTAWILFLICYYSMFDGATKPFLVNLFLIIALLLPILHSLYGYYYNKFLTDGSNVKMALEQLYNRLRKYALISIVARVGFVLGLLLFFTYSIHFTKAKYYSLVFIGIIFLIQMLVLCQVWIRRLRSIKHVVDGF